MEELYIGDLEFYDEVYIGDLEVDIIKLEPETEQIEIIPEKEEQVKEGLFDKVTVKGYGNREVRKFSSIEEMNNTVGEEGELATVYFKGFEPVQQDSEFRYVYFPKTVVLDESEKLVDISYSTAPVAYDENGKTIGGGSFTIYPAGGSFVASSMKGYREVKYTSTDGMTYTRTDSYEDVVDLFTEFVFSNELKPVLKKFAFIPVENYEGLYEYANGTWNLIAPKGIIEITENGQYDVSDYAEANINVKGIDTSDATATADKILEGQTAYVNNEKVIGTMKNNGILTITPDIYEQIIEEGYIEGGTVQAVTSDIDSNIKAENIKKDVEILGVIGTLEETSGSGDEELEASFLSSIDDSLGANVTKLPKGITCIGEYAFYNCEKLALAELPDEIVKIGIYAFYKCTYLALTKLPEGITSVGNYAFYNCSNLALTKLPSEMKYINGYAFYGCTNLALTELPEGIVEIGNYAFYKCTNLALTKLPNKTTAILDYAFDGCTNLALTELPDEITKIYRYAFRECTSLALKELPDRLTSINQYVFYGCTNLKELTCKGAVTSIGTYAFNSCTNLSKLVLPNITKVPTLSNVNSFADTPIANGTGYIYVPDDLVDSFKTATNWSTYANQIKGLSELEG